MSRNVTDIALLVLLLSIFRLNSRLGQYYINDGLLRLVERRRHGLELAPVLLHYY